MTILDKHIKQFLELYHNFRLVNSKKAHIRTLRGIITVVDENSQLWADYDVRIEISSAYPHTIPSVYEESKLIERDWDFHISKERKMLFGYQPFYVVKKKKWYKTN